MNVDRFIRMRDLPDIVGLRRTAIEQLIEQGKFPRPIPLTDAEHRGAKAWSAKEVAEWQEARKACRDGGEAR